MKISVGTIARTIVLILALINQIFAIVGIPALNIDESTVYELCSLVFTTVTALVAWWKNNSFTAEALRGDITKNGILDKGEDLYG